MAEEIQSIPYRGLPPQQITGLEAGTAILDALHDNVEELAGQFSSDEILEAANRTAANREVALLNMQGDATATSESVPLTDGQAAVVRQALRLAMTNGRNERERLAALRVMYSHGDMPHNVRQEIERLEGDLGVHKRLASLALDRFESGHYDIASITPVERARLRPPEGETHKRGIRGLLQRFRGDRSSPTVKRPAAGGADTITIPRHEPAASRPKILTHRPRHTETVAARITPRMLKRAARQHERELQAHETAITRERADRQRRHEQSFVDTGELSFDMVDRLENRRLITEQEAAIEAAERAREAEANRPLPSRNPGSHFIRPLKHTGRSPHIAATRPQEVAPASRRDSHVGPVSARSAAAPTPVLRGGRHRQGVPRRPASHDA